MRRCAIGANAGGNSPRSCRNEPRSGSAPLWSHRGFTLVEILVVLLVLALAAGFAYARFDSDPRQSLERESRRLASAVEHAALLAQWKNETLGISTDRNRGGYRFWRRTATSDGDRWQALSDDDVLQARALPSPLVAAVIEYAGQPQTADAIVPLSPSGRNEPYVIEIASPRWFQRLSADPLNRVDLSAPVAR